MGTTRTFGQQLRDLRGDMPLRELAERTRAADPGGRGLSYAYLSKLERGAAPAAPPVMELIARTFGIDAGRFLEHRLHVARLALDERHAGLESAADALLRFENPRAA